MKAIVAAAMLAALIPAAASAQIGDPVDRQRIYDETPRCADHPDYPVIGRVSGGTEDFLDRILPVSFVGCFPDLATCERWKGRTSAIIVTTIIQYSCKPRG